MCIACVQATKMNLPQLINAYNELYVDYAALSQHQIELFEAIRDRIKELEYEVFLSTLPYNVK